MRLPAFSRFFKQPTLTGIDIQPEAITLVQLRHGRQAVVPQKIAVLPLETGVFSEGKICDWDKLAILLYDWLRELDLVGAVAATALTMQSVKLLRVPGRVLDESQLHAPLEQVLPGLGEAVALDYCPLDSGEAATLMAVTKRDYLDQYVACLSEAGLNVKVVDVDLLAVQRAFGVSEGALLWQQRGKFTLIWQDENHMPQQSQWPATYGEQVIAELSHRLAQLNIETLQFCGSSYYTELIKKAQNITCAIQYFTPPFNGSGINMPDYLLAMGLAMREVPRW